MASLPIKDLSTAQVKVKETPQNDLWGTKSTLKQNNFRSQYEISLSLNAALIFTIF